MRPIRGFEDYLISDVGKVYSTKSKRFLKTRISNRGYVLVSLCLKGRHYVKNVHRLVADAYLGGKFFNAQINHINGDKFDNSIGNLEWVTPKTNMHRAVYSGLIKTGELAPGAKLRNCEVENIRNRWRAGNVSQGELAKEYGVNQSTVCRIVNYKRRKHQR